MSIVYFSINRLPNMCFIKFTFKYPGFSMLLMTSRKTRRNRRTELSFDLAARFYRQSFLFSCCPAQLGPSCKCAARLFDCASAVPPCSNCLFPGQQENKKSETNKQGFFSCSVAFPQIARHTLPMRASRCELGPSCKRFLCCEQLLNILSALLMHRNVSCEWKHCEGGL